MIEIISNNINDSSCKYSYRLCSLYYTIVSDHTYNFGYKPNSVISYPNVKLYDQNENLFIYLCKYSFRLSIFYYIIVSDCTYYFGYKPNGVISYRNMKFMTKRKMYFFSYLILSILFFQ